MSGTDMVCGNRLNPLCDWLWFGAVGDLLATDRDLEEACDLLIFSSQDDKLAVFLLKRPILGFLIDTPFKHCTWHLPTPTQQACKSGDQQQ